MTADLGLTAASVETNTIGNNTVIAAVANKQIKVYKAQLALASQTTIAFKSATSTTIYGPATVTGLTWDTDANPWLTTNIGEALTLVLGAGVLCGGTLYYKLV